MYIFNRGVCFFRLRYTQACGYSTHLSRSHVETRRTAGFERDRDKIKRKTHTQINHGSHFTLLPTVYSVFVITQYEFLVFSLSQM